MYILTFTYISIFGGSHAGLRHGHVMPRLVILNHESEPMIVGPLGKLPLDVLGVVNIRIAYDR